MQTVGLLFPQSGHLASLIVGGIPVLERQARLLRHAGITRLFAVDPVPLTLIPEGVEAVRAVDLIGRITAGERVAAFSPGVVLDERAVAAVLSAPTPALLTWDAARPGSGGVERLDALTWAVGFMTVPGKLLRDTVATLGDWDLASTLLHAAAADTATVRIEFGTLPVYAPGRRRDVPMAWALPQTDAEAAAAGEILLAAAQKGVLDWPAWLVHPPIENALTRLLAPTRVTPNAVTLFTAGLGLLAGLSLATGWLWSGLVLALICGPLDGVDGKLARLRQEFSRWGDLEHVLDKVLEYGWYLCAAWWFAGQGAGGLAWAVAALIIVPALAEAIQGEFFRRMTGMQLDDAGPTERRIRLVAGRRNTFLWAWLGFALAGAWFQGFVFLAIYSVLTTGVAQWRFYVRLSAYGREHGERIAANIAGTGYAFLPRGKL